MPPWMARLPPAERPALVCLFRMFTPRTTTLPSRGRVRSTSPCLPRSLPATTTTGSPGARSSLFSFGWGLFLSKLEHLRSQGHDLHEVALAQLTRDRAEDARAPGIVLVVDDHGGVVVEPDVRAIRTPILLRHAYDDLFDHLALLHLSARLRGLHGRGDDVAYRRVAAIVTAGHANGQQLLGAAVISHLEPALLLDHRRQPLTKPEVPIVSSTIPRILTEPSRPPRRHASACP